MIFFSELLSCILLQKHKSQKIIVELIMVDGPRALPTSPPPPQIRSQQLTQVCVFFSEVPETTKVSHCKEKEI